MTEHEAKIDEAADAFRLPTRLFQAGESEKGKTSLVTNLSPPAT